MAGMPLLIAKSENDYAAVLSRLKKDLDLRTRERPPLSKSPAPSDKVADMQPLKVGALRRCALCSAEISTSKKNCMQCLSCSSWCCKSCSVWDSVKSEYVCQTCITLTEPTSVHGLLGLHVIDEKPEINGIDVHASGEILASLLESASFGSLLNVSPTLPNPTETRESNALGLQNIFSRNGSIQDGTNHANEYADSGTQQSEYFDVLKDKEVKKFLLQMHALLNELEQNVANNSLSQQSDSVLTAYQKKVTTAISNLEEALHFAVDDQMVCDGHSFASHNEVEMLVCQAVEPYIGSGGIFPAEESYTITAQAMNFYKTAEHLGKLVVDMAIKGLAAKYGCQGSIKIKHNDESARQPTSSLSSEDPNNLIATTLSARHSTAAFPSFPVNFELSCTDEIDPDLLSISEVTKRYGEREESAQESNWIFKSRSTRSNNDHKGDNTLHLKENIPVMFMPKRSSSSLTQEDGVTSSTSSDSESDFYNDSFSTPELEAVPRVVAGAVEEAYSSGAGLERQPSVVSHTPVPAARQFHNQTSSPAADLVKPEPPAFLKPLTDVDVLEGDELVTLRCKIRAQPPLTSLCWYKDGALVTDGVKYRLGRMGNRDYTLSIEGSVTMYDDAEYLVVARNEAGESRSCAQLIVEPRRLSTAPQPKNTVQASEREMQTQDVKSPRHTLLNGPSIGVDTNRNGITKTIKTKGEASSKAVMQSIGLRSDRPLGQALSSSRSDLPVVSSSREDPAALELPRSPCYEEGNSSSSSSVGCEDASQSDTVIENAAVAGVPPARKPVKSLRAARLSGVTAADVSVPLEEASHSTQVTELNSAREAVATARSQSSTISSGGNAPSARLEAGELEASHSRAAAPSAVKSVADIPSARTLANLHAKAAVVQPILHAILQESGCLVDVRPGLSRQLQLEEAEALAADSVSAVANLASGSDKDIKNNLAPEPVSTKLIPNGTRKIVKKIIVVRRTAAMQ